MSFLFRVIPRLTACMLFIFFAKFFAFKALIFTDTVVLNPFHVSCFLVLTKGVEEGLKCSGLSNLGLYERWLGNLG